MVGIAAGDLDGDGDADLVAVDQPDTIKVLLNDGVANFTLGEPCFVEGLLTSIAVGDLDGDNVVDLAVSNWNYGLSILIGNGDGTFRLPAFYDTGDLANSVAICDLNGDGTNDVAVANTGSWPPKSNLHAGEEAKVVGPYTVSILLNNGDGNLMPAINYGTSGVPTTFFACDFDGDGDSDLVTANNLTSNASILENTGDGTFVSSVEYGTAPTPWSVIASDLDGDGDADLVVSNQMLMDILLQRRRTRARSGTSRQAAVIQRETEAQISHLKRSNMRLM